MHFWRKAKKRGAWMGAKCANAGEEARHEAAIEALAKGDALPGF